MIVADVFHGQPDEVLSPGGGSGCSEPPPCRFGVFFTFWWRIQQISLDSDMTSSSTRQPECSTWLLGKVHP